MKNFIKARVVPFFGIASALVIGFLMTACGTKEEILFTDGLLTINGLGNYIGVSIDSDSVWADVGEYYLSAVEKITTKENSQDYWFPADSKITGHSITLKVYSRYQEEYRDNSGTSYSSYKYYSYNGNHKNVKFNFRGVGTVTVDFTDGVGVGEFVSNLDNGGNSNGGQTSENGYTVTDKTFTITDIPPEYNGKYARFDSVSTLLLYGRQYDTRNFVNVYISNGSVSIPVWSSLTTRALYFGNGTTRIDAQIFESELASGTLDILTEIRFNSVTFSNGSAQKSWNEGTITK